VRAGQLLSLAWRESRFARRRLLLFLSAISLGVAALVAVKGFASNLARGVEEQAKTLLGADAELSSGQKLGKGTEAVLDSLRRSGVEVARVTSLSSMALAPRTGGVRLVQVRAVDPGFPFYGEILTSPAGSWAELERGNEAIVDPALLTTLGARVGDALQLGAARFRIAGALRRVPGDVEIASAFAPRVYLPAAALRRTGLVDFGSRVEYAAYLRLPQPGAAERLLDSHRPLFRAEHVRTRTSRQEEESLGRALGRLSSFLGLVAVFALLLGGIGVASAMGAYMAQKVDTVAVLRCLGATARQVIGIYLAQAAMMGLAGALLGVVLGSAVQWVLPRLVQGLLPVEVEVRLDGVAIATGIGVGIWTALVFALLPLLGIRRVSPLGALRRRVEALHAPRRDLLRWGAWAALGASVYGLLALQVGSAVMGVGLLGGVLVTLLLLWLAAWALTRLVRRTPRGTLSYPARQGLANLHRPGNQTRTVVVALGFGVFLLATLLLMQRTLLEPLRTEAAGRANLLLWDVQEDQASGVGEVLRRAGLPLVQRAPIIPMRVAAIDGKEVRAERVDSAAEEEGAPPPEEQRREGRERGQPEGWALRREYRSTYRDSLVDSEELLRGRWWDPGRIPDGGPYPVSLEEGIASDLAVDLGDTIVWNVQGVRISTVVASVRKVDWARFEPNFFAVFPAKALEGAPQTWVLLTRADSTRERAAVQGELVRRYPNISVLDLSQVQAALDEVVGRVTAVIRFMAAFSVATGFLVLLGAVSTSRLQRVRESVLLKTIGATRSQIGAILFTEYLLLGLLSAVAGTLLALGAGWALARWTFHVDFTPAPLALAGLAAAVAVLAVAIGLLASREVFERTPLEAIREE
jgi:putative ABC transport system permease protein